MTLNQSLLTAIFCMTVVFVVLIVIWALLRLFSALIIFIESKKKQSDTNSNLKI